MVNRLSRFWYSRSLGLLLLRVVTGIIFLVHGTQKLENLPMTAHFFTTLGLPAWVATFVALVEVIGGIMLVLGVATRAAGVVLGIDMIAAIFLTGVGRGFHAHEFELLLGAVAFALALIGSGRLSVYKMECESCGGMLCRGGAECTVVRQ